jgi:hypothetical protein
MDRTDQLVAR